MSLHAVTGLFIENGLVWALSRRNNDDDLGLIGGKIEHGETPEQALCREVCEEIDVKVIEFESIFESTYSEDHDRTCRCYRVNRWIGIPVAKERGFKFVKVPPERLIRSGCSFRNYNEKVFKLINII